MPEIGEVTGTVTLNGQPLEGALVEFQPESGRPSSAVTDAEGHYVLLYSDGVEGAAVGTHTVSITSRRDASGGEGDEPVVEARPETVPQQYNDESTLKVEVKEGVNTHDFTLEGERGPERRRAVNDA